MRAIGAITVAVATVVLGAGAAMANSPSLPLELIQNGSFENGAYSGGAFMTVNSPDSTTISNWSVTSGSVDWINGYWQASDGNRSVDLCGNEPGTISQRFTIQANGSGRLSFDLAGNPDNDVLKTLDVRIQPVGSQSNLLSGSYSFSQAGHDKSNMGWVTITEDFTVAGHTTPFQADVVFTATTAGPWGPALDNVKVEYSAVPEATTMVLGIAAVMPLLTHRRRRTAKA